MGNFQLARPYDIEPVPSPLEQETKALELKGVMQRAKINDVVLQQGQMNLQQAQQEQKDMKMYAKIYLVTGNSEKTEQVFLENGGSPVFAAKMREQRKAALIAEEEHTRKSTGDKLAAEKMKNDEIASI